MSEFNQIMMNEQIMNGMAMQQVKTQYTTAITVQKPRSIAKIAKDVIEEAKLAGTDFYYSWEVFDKEKGRKVPIEGASINLAMCMARNYLNCAVDVEVNETPTHYLFKGVFIDLETGFTCPRLFRQRKSQKISGKMDADRQEDMIFQLGQSKAIRNAVVRATPSWIFDQAIQEAKAAAIAKIKPDNLALARSQVLDLLAKYGIKQERAEAERGRIADEWTAKDIVDLKGIITGIKEGRVSPDEIFPPEVSSNNDDEKPKSAIKPNGLEAMAKNDAATPKSKPKPQKPDIKPNGNDQALTFNFIAEFFLQLNYPQGYSDKFIQYCRNKYSIEEMTELDQDQLRDLNSILLAAKSSLAGDGKYWTGFGEALSKIQVDQPPELSGQAEQLTI